MSSDFKMTTWNMGANISDYLIRSRELHTRDSDREQVESRLRENYQTVDTIAANTIFTDKNVIGSVVMFQEHKFKVFPDNPSVERAEVKKLVDELNYRICKADGRREQLYGPDLSIAIDPDRFAILSQQKIGFDNGTQALVVFAKDRATQKTIAFITLAIPGSNISGTPEQNEADESAINVNRDCRALVAWINEQSRGCDYICIGGDFNACPEKMPSRFSIFTEAGFQISRSGQPTELNYDPRYGGDVYNQRELDFFMIRKQQPHGIFSHIKRLFSKTMVVDPATTLGSFDSHGSDHAPLQTTVRFGRRGTFFGGLKRWFGRIFKLS